MGTLRNKPKKYQVHIEETLVGTIEVWAHTMQDAIKIAKDKYLDGEVILTADNFDHVTMQAESADGTEYTAWEDI